MYYQSTFFPFVADLESQWKMIRGELGRYLTGRSEQVYTPYPSTIPYTKEWKLLGIYQSEAGSSGIPKVDEQMAENVRYFPRTGALLKRIPGLLHAGFSKITPGTHIRPHQENYGNKLRCHLGLKVPGNDSCGFMVAGKIKSWREGKCLLFDGNSFHEAWNYGDTNRIVLLIDFDRDIALHSGGATTSQDPSGQRYIEPYSLKERLAGQLMRIRARHHRSRLRAARKKNK